MNKGGALIKLLFIFYVPSGGMETLNRQRCKALQGHGIHCQLLYLQNGSGLQNISQIPTHVTNDDAQLRSLLQREQYDAIIISSNYFMLKRIRQLGYLGPVIYEVQGLGSKETARDVLIEAQPYVKNHAHAVLYPRTSHLIELFQKQYPTFRKYCFHNCIDTDHFWYRSSIKYPYPIVGWVGRIEPNKNWRSFLEIGKQLILQNPSIKLWLFEDETISTQKAEFQQYVRHLGLAPYLVRRSNVPHQHMVDYYSMIGDSGGFLCSTSIVEGFGYAVVEAMCCRCPVVTSDSDGVRSFITHNITGKFYNQGDTKGAVREALNVMNNHTLRENIRNNGQKHIKANFSTKLYCKHFIAMLKELGAK
jgi:glycosyltransferase involved in cell wall biosynthesis